MANLVVVQDENCWLPAGSTLPLQREDIGQEEQEPEGSVHPWMAEAQFVVGFGVQVRVPRTYTSPLHCPLPDI